jgi:hypothetical protein
MCVCFFPARIAEVMEDMVAHGTNIPATIIERSKKAEQRIDLTTFRRTDAAEMTQKLRQLYRRKGGNGYAFGIRNVVKKFHIN